MEARIKIGDTVTFRRESKNSKNIINLTLFILNFIWNKH